MPGEAQTRKALIVKKSRGKVDLRVVDRLESLDKDGFPELRALHGRLRYAGRGTWPTSWLVPWSARWLIHHSSRIPYPDVAARSSYYRIPSESAEHYYRYYH